MMATDEEIATAFNAGYTMQQVDPGIIEKILSTDNSDSEIIQGMKEGAKQHQREKIIKEQQRIKEQQQTKKPKR